MTPTVTYRRLEQIERPRPGFLVFRVLDAMKASGKFWRSTRGAMLFEPEPGQFLPLVRTPEIVGVLRDSGVIEWAGDPVPDSEWAPLAMGVNDFRWKLSCCNRYEPARIAAAPRQAVRS